MGGVSGGLLGGANDDLGVVAWGEAEGTGLVVGEMADLLHEVERARPRGARREEEKARPAPG